MHKESQNMVKGDSMLNNVENKLLLFLNNTVCNNSPSSDQYTTNQITRPSKFELISTQLHWRNNKTLYITPSGGSWDSAV